MIITFIHQDVKPAPETMNWAEQEAPGLRDGGPLQVIRENAGRRDQLHKFLQIYLEVAQVALLHFFLCYIFSLPDILHVQEIISE